MPAAATRAVATFTVWDQPPTTSLPLTVTVPGSVVATDTVATPDAATRWSFAVDRSWIVGATVSLCGVGVVPLPLPAPAPAPAPGPAPPPGVGVGAAVAIGVGVGTATSGSLVQAGAAASPVVVSRVACAGNAQSVQLAGTA